MLQSKKGKKAIVLIPFNLQAVVHYHLLIADGASVTDFYDNDIALWGKRYCDCRISDPSVLAEGNSDVSVLICSEKHSEMISKQLRSLGLTDIQNAEGLCKQEIKEAMSEFNVNDFQEIGTKQANLIHKLPWYVNRLVSPAALRHKETIVLPILELIVTEKCSLRCEKCANLMQYFTKPRNMDITQVKDDIDRVFTNIDYIHEFYFFGGEVFLFPQLAEALYYTEKYSEQYGRQMIITNGTIVPDEKTLTALHNTGVLVSISNYGEHSKKINALSDALQKFDIPYLVNNVRWFEYQQLVDGEKRDAQAIFDLCKENCVSVLSGKLFRCPLLLHGETLGALPLDDTNSVCLSKELRSKHLVREYLSSTTAPGGCAYCSGYDVGHMTAIPTAVQAEAPIPYREYC